MSRRGSKIFPNIDLENVENSPKLGRGNSSTNLFATNDTTMEDDEMSVSSNRSGKKKKNSISNNQAEPSPRTPRSSFNAIQASMITGSPAPRQPRLSKQLSFQDKSNNTSNQSNQTPPLRRAKSSLDDDNNSVSSSHTGTPNTTGRKSFSAKKSIRKNSLTSIPSSKKKRVSFKHPLIDPTPEAGASNYAVEHDPHDQETGLIESDSSKRKAKQRRRRDDDEATGCGVGCVIA